MNDDYMFEDETIQEEKIEVPPYPQPRNDMGVAITSFVLGIVSLVFFVSFINGVTAILAIILAIMFLVKNRGQQGKAFAITGLLTGIASIALLVISLLAVASNISHVIPLYNDTIKTYGLEDEYPLIEIEDGVYYIPEDID